MSDTDLKYELFKARVEAETLRRFGKGISREQLLDVVGRAWEKIGAHADPDGPVWTYELDLLFSSLKAEAAHLITPEASVPQTQNTTLTPGSARQRLELANQKIAAERATATDDAA